MHRRILLSAAYQASSQAPARLREADPDNRLWGRANRRRLEAEEIHDSLLALAGRLEDHPGGPAGSDPASPRRLIYLGTSRTDRSDFGSIFDRADSALHVERRTISTVAPQALYLMNHPWVMDQARALARRCEVAGATDANEPDRDPPPAGLRPAGNGGRDGPGTQIRRRRAEGAGADTPLGPVRAGPASHQRIPLCGLMVS